MSTPAQMAAAEIDRYDAEWHTKRREAVAAEADRITGNPFALGTVVADAMRANPVAWGQALAVLDAVDTPMARHTIRMLLRASVLEAAQEAV